MSYSSKHVELIYSVSHETVRRWAEEFEEYLSPTANPGKGKHRIFTAEDMKVLTLVSDSKAQGLTFEEIHASLKNGQRGEPPALPPGEIQALVVGEHERRLSLEIEFLKRSLDEALIDARKAEEYREENIRLKAQLETGEQRVQELQDRLNQAHEELEKARNEAKDLSREVGEAYVKGVMETLRGRGDLPDKK